MSLSSETRTETYGDYAHLLGDRAPWKVGTFPLSDGKVWEMREPEAVAMVRNGNLQISVAPLTRFHDRHQILDNAKHVLFSTRTFSVPPEGGISFEVSMRVGRLAANPSDLYDGYGSLLCLDFSTGTAIDWFLAEEVCAPAFARLPFPGLSLPPVDPFKYWAIFRETTLYSTPDGFHRLRLEIEPARGIAWWADGEEVAREKPLPYALGDLTLGLGIMTEKDIGPGGSASLHGQGVQAEWSPIEIETWLSAR